MNEIKLVTNTDGDYEALYLNGLIVSQNHSVPKHELNQTFMENQPYNYETFEVSAEWLEEEGGLYPNKLIDIPDDAREDFDDYS